MSRIGRHLKDGFTGVFRHFALSLSSISSVTVTLLLMSMFLFLNVNIEAMTKNVEKSVQIHVQLNHDIEEKTVKELEEEIKKNPEVETIKFSTKEEELEYFIEMDGSEEAEDLYGQYRGENNPFLDAFLITIKEGEQIKSVTDRVSELDGVYYASYGGDGTGNLMETLQQVRNVGLVTVIFLTAVAIFLIANTIRVSVQSRQKEISIMRTVGASNWYIRWPFIIEGMIIGFIGSIVPVLVSVFLYKYILDGTGGVIWSTMFKLVPAEPLVYQISGLLALIGTFVGALGSMLTVGRLLRWSR
ncbi:permease-like cell division protein FtsX [Erysipelothrix urinaevulpis]|uniref:permease-like cell division protein FtsX n=1 Tax=Erysipelothrix urinaevulpis TaxID=2683717 RepID=UPI0013576056|nr:permease-like cell division protein FtsX [Erysipelothrix urinaevulpis]